MTRPAPPPQAHAGLPVNKIMLTFAMRIRGWSKADLARASGVAESHISRLLSGENGASLATVQKIRRAFEDRIEWDELVVVEHDDSPDADQDEHPDGVTPTPPYRPFGDTYGEPSDREDD